MVEATPPPPYNLHTFPSNQCVTVLSYSTVQHESPNVSGQSRPSREQRIQLYTLSTTPR